MAARSRRWCWPTARLLDATTWCWRPATRARDLFADAGARGVHLEPKPFSVGVRIEHPQSVIDRARFGAFAGHPRWAPPTTSWCTTAAAAAPPTASACAPAAPWWPPTSEPGRVVTNGMSQYSRAERNANAGIVVGVGPADFARGRADPLAGIAFQRRLGTAGLRGRRRHLRGARPARRRLPRRPRQHVAGRRGAVLQPGVVPDRPCRLPAAMRCWRHPRGAAGLRPPDPGLRHGRRGDDRRGDAHLLARSASPAAPISRASTPRACTPPARGRATRAASYRRPWTACGSPKPWPSPPEGLCRGRP